MTRPITLVLTLVATLLTVPLATALPVDRQDPVLDPTVPLHDQDVQELSACGGFAPLTTECQLEHTVHDDYTHTCAGGPTYTGTVVSHAFFTHDIETWVTCHYENGELIDRSATGAPFYITPSSVTHTCTSYDYKTSDEGGSGSWSCLFLHD